MTTTNIGGFNLRITKSKSVRKFYIVIQSQTVISSWTLIITTSKAILIFY